MSMRCGFAASDVVLRARAAVAAPTRAGLDERRAACNVPVAMARSGTVRRGGHARTTSVQQVQPRKDRWRDCALIIGSVGMISRALVLDLFHRENCEMSEMRDPRGRSCHR